MRNTFEGKEFDRSPLGIWVESIERDRVLYSHDPDRSLVPASNLKIVTTAAGLSVLGADYRFRTCLRYSGKIEGEVLDGDLVVVASGDPTLGGKLQEDSPTAVFEKWAEELKSRGIRTVSGDVIGDDDLFSDESTPAGWKDHYLISPYAAQSSALSFNDNCIKVFFDPGPSVGSPARIRLSPPTSYVTIDGTVKTVPASQKTVIGFDRAKGTNRIVVKGHRSMRKENRYDYATIHNPTLYAATVLAETLRNSGIRIDGKPVDIDDLPEERKVFTGETLCEYVSPPLSAILPMINKESQNLYANQIFLTVGSHVGLPAGRRRYDPGQAFPAAGSREFTSAGWAESATAVHTWLRSIFVDPQGLVMDDGSGLSVLDRTTARQLAGILKYMHRHPDRQVFVDSFAVAGEDGTLRKRLNGTKAEGRVLGKTGYIKDVRSLSGYVTTIKGETIVFSFLLNNAERIGSRFKVLVDQALLDLTYLE